MTVANIKQDIHEVKDARRDHGQNPTAPPTRT